MMKFRNSLFATTAVIACSSALLMASCSPKDKGVDAQISTEAAPLGLTAPTEAVFARHFDVSDRQVSEDEASKALKALSLEKEGAMFWESKSGTDGDYIYTDLGAKTDDGQITIAKAELIGVHMQGEDASFDRVNFQDMKIESTDVNLEIAAMSIARPSPKMAQAIMKALQTNEGIDDLEIDIDAGEDISFGALSLKDIQIDGEEANGTIEQIVWGVDEATNIGDAKIGPIDFTLKGENDITSKFTFEGGSALGLNMQPYEDLDVAEGNVMGLGQILSKLNVYAKPFDSFSFGKGAFTNEFVAASFDGFEGKAVEKNGVTTITQIGKPMTLAFLKAPTNPQAQMGYQTLQQLGFDEISFNTSQTQILDANKDTITVENGLLEMKDGFRLNYTYAAEGLSAMAEKAKLSEAKPSTASPTVDMADILNDLEPIKLQNMKMSLEDKSIVERGLKLASEMTGQSESNIKKQLKIAVIAAPFMAKNDLESAMIGELGNAFVEFLEGGGTLTVALQPPQPLSVKALAEARDNNLDPQALGFSSKVE